MNYFKPTKQLPVDTWAKVILLNKDTETDKWNNEVFNVEVDGEKMTWSVKPTSKAYQNIMNFNSGDAMAVKWFQGDKWPATVVGDPRDAKTKAEVLQQPKRDPIEQKAVSKGNDDLDKKITMGMCMNCASRIVATKGMEKLSHEALADQVVSLAKAIYAEYTQEKPAEPKEVASEEPVLDEPELSDLPF